MAAAPAAMNTAAQQHRHDDADVEHLVHGQGRHGEPGHDDDEDEQVVDAQAVLGDVAGDELAARRPRPEDEQPDREQRPRARRRRAPRGRLPHRHRGLAAGDDDQVEHDDGHEAERRSAIQTSGRHGSEHESSEGVAEDDGSKVSSARVPRTSSTGNADEAFRDDDTAAKEYSPSSWRGLTDDAVGRSATGGESSPGRRESRRRRVAAGDHLGWLSGRRRSRSGRTWRGVSPAAASSSRGPMTSGAAGRRHRAGGGRDLRY